MALEVVGALLSSISLAIQICDRLLPRIAAFRDYKKKTQLLTATLDGQRLIFRNKAKNLVAALNKDHTLLEAWLSQDRSLPLEGDVTLFPTAVQEDLGQCLQIAQEIQRALGEIEFQLIHHVKQQTRRARSKAIAGSSGPSVASGSTTTSTAIMPITSGDGGLLMERAFAPFKRLKYAVFQDQWLPKSIDQLRKLNADFGTIAKAILKDIRLIVDSQRCTRSDKASRPVNASITERYRWIRSASSALYNTISAGWVCFVHERHCVSVSVAHETEDNGPAKMNVTLAISEASQDYLTSPPPVKETLWFEVMHLDNKVKQTGTNAQSTNPASEPSVLRDLRAALNHGNDINATSPNRAKAPITTSKGKGKARETSPPQCFDQDPDSGSPVDDFCQHFAERYKADALTPDCLGCLKGDFYHRLFWAPENRRYSGNALSVSDVIAKIKSQEAGVDLLGPQLVREMAANLAVAVLNFHSTPWLPETWRSDDIKFFDHQALTNHTEQQFAPSQPHLQAKLPREQQTQTTNEHTRPGEQTELFFRFGIVLLELGFSRPWKELLDIGYRDFRLTPARRTEYHVALKWCDRLKSAGLVGARYVAFVEECICWDFTDIGEQRGKNRNLKNSEEEQQLMFFSNMMTEMQRVNAEWENFMQGI
ncbi:hypothetical protein QBC43DRAFT_311916 [Cladorrhinum sp. PSN259]|nr:hypothetical protein QBC43DRAFT_311916 [Cladorrhinum sp. PSN259]